MAKLNAEVHMICRNATRCAAAKDFIIAATNNQKIHTHICDMSSTEDIKDFSKDFSEKYEKLDVLVHNAGSTTEFRNITEEGKELSMATALGGFLLADLLLPKLQKATDGGRFITVSSSSAYTVKARIDDLNTDELWATGVYDGQFTNSIAKRNQIEIAETFAAKLKEKGVENVDVYTMHPGWVDTPGVQISVPKFYAEYKGMMRSGDQGADTITYLAACPNVKGVSGKFWFDRQPLRTHMTFAYTRLTPEEKEKLWTNTSVYFGGFKNV
jgi:dehydrogenase/reductase SDR family protein 12